MSTVPKTRVAVVGDAGEFATDEKLAVAAELGRLLVDNGFVVVSGGLGGVMAAACEGAKRSSKNGADTIATVGIVPQADAAKANGWLDIVLPTDLSHGRNQLVALSDAVVAIGGGAGTLSEMCFGWLHRRLLVALRCDGWSGKLADTGLDDRVRIPEIKDDRIYGASSAAEVISLLAELLPRYKKHQTQEGLAPRSAY